MPNLTLMFLHVFVEPVLLIGLVVVVLFAMCGVDGVPIAKTLILLFANIVVGIVSWFFRVLLTVLCLLLPGLAPILLPGTGKTRGKANNRIWWGF